MKIKIIIPYFGEFVDYMDLFLESCRRNSEFDFLIFSDQQPIENLSSNVYFDQISFSELRKLIINKLGEQAVLFSPYKLCDYKPLYGIIFSDYLKDADYWGYCDIDLILGKIGDFIPTEIWGRYEKIQTQGHLTFYKNTNRMNYMYRTQLPEGIDSKKMMRTKEPCFFDEIMFDAICRRMGVSLFESNQFADILPQYGDFKMADNKNSVKNEKGQSFYWEKGKIFRKYKKDGREMLDEWMYIHLQKREIHMFCIREDIKDGKIYITPQGIYTESNYEEKNEKPNIMQPFIYQFKRWKTFTPKKLWIKKQIVKVRRNIDESRDSYI